MKKCLLVLFCLLLLVGCSGGNSGGNEPEGETSDVIVIGGSGPLTGGAAVYGNAVKNGAEIAVEEVNALGGLQFKLCFEDDEHNTEKAVTAFNVLMDEGMQVGLSCTTSDPATTTSPLYNEHGIFALTPSASSPSVTLANANDPNSYYGNVFQMCFTDPNLGTGAATYISANSLGSKVAIIWKNDDPYSTGIHEKFIVKAAEAGLEIVSDSTFDSSSAQDFSVQLIDAQSKGADLVFLPMYYDPASLILAQADQMGYKPLFFGVDGMDGILELEGFDKSLAEGVYLLTPFSADAQDEKTVNFVKKFKEKTGEVPNQFAADAYDCVWAIYQACVDNSVTGSMSPQEICDVLVKAFTSMSFEGVTGVSSWSANGEVSKMPLAVIIKDGVYVSAE